MEVEILKSIDKKLELIVNHLINKTKKKEDDKPKDMNMKTYTSNKKTYMSEYKNAILLHGNTYDIKHLLKSFGGLWNSANKGWVLALNKKERIIDLVKNLVCNNTKMSKTLKNDNGEEYEFTDNGNDFLSDSD